MKKGYDIIFLAWPGFKLETSGLFLNASSKCVHNFFAKMKKYRKSNLFIYYIFAEKINFDLILFFTSNKQTF